MKSHPTYNYIDDLPLDDARDFNFDRMVSVMSRFITNTQNPTPFSICIDGGWGSGKTSLMRTLARQLQEISTGKGKSCTYIPLWFEPWKLSDETQVLNSLVNHVLRKIEDDAALLAHARIEVDRKDALRLLSKRFLEINPDEFSAYYQWSSRLQGSFVEVEDLFRKVTKAYLGDTQLSRVFVVFVDDLDRCPPARVVTVLEAMKLFFNMRGFVFVFGMDRQQIVKAVLEKYEKFSEADAKVYLEKMFQLVFTLPVKDEQSLIDFVSRAMVEMDLRIRNRDLLRALVDTFGRNLRNLKTFLNSLNFQRHLIIHSGEILNDEIFFKWLYAETTLPSTFDLTIRRKSPDFLIALEFIAQGGLLGNAERRESYIKCLSSQRIQYVPLLIWSLLSNQELSDMLDPQLLDLEQKQFVDTLRQDGHLAQALLVLGQGDAFLFDQDLSQLAYLTRREEVSTSESFIIHGEGQTSKEASFKRGFILSDQAWDALGDKLYSQVHYRSAYFAYLAALLLDFSDDTYWTDLGNVYRRLGYLIPAKALYKQAYRLNSNSANLYTQVGYLWDMDIDDDYRASLCYRKVLMLGNTIESVPYNLSWNMKVLGDNKRAFYFALQAYSINQKDNTKSRVKAFAIPYGKDGFSFDSWNNDLANELASEEAQQLLTFPLNEQEEEELKSLIEGFPELSDAANELCWLPL